MKNMKRILSVKVIRECDTNPDTSYLGAYGNTAKTEYAIDRAHAEDCPINTGLASELLPEEDRAECDCGEHGRMSRHEYRYFNACVENYEGESPEDIRKYVRQDYDRMESLNNGNWQYIGIRAEAEYAVVYGGKSSLSEHVTTGGSGPVQTVHSGGLYGIESDSGREYLESVEKEELASLREQLRALGFSTRAISKAFVDIEHVDE